MASNRFLMVPVDSSAARMPLPGATMAVAILFNASRSIALSSLVASLAALGRGRLPHGRRRALDPQDLDPRQCLAFHPLQERPAGGRNIGEPLGHPGDVEGGH